MGPGDSASREPLPTVHSGEGDWGPPGLWMRGELWTKAIGLDIVGSVGRPEGVAVYC